MITWKHVVAIKHLFTREGDHASIQASMNAIADELAKHECFADFDTTDFRFIPQGDRFFSPSDYANKLLAAMYDYADEHRIWIN